MLHRKIIDNPYYFAEKFTKVMAWIDLLLLANHSKRIINIRGVEIEINRGQLARSEETLAKRWKWSRGKVRRFLSSLKSKQQIEQQKNNVTTLITIVNYNEYQKRDTTTGTPDRTTDGHQTEQQTDINNNVNNDSIMNNNEKKLNFSFADIPESLNGLKELWLKYLEVYEITHGAPAVPQQELLLQDLMRIPEEHRKEALTNATRGGWKVIPDPRKLDGEEVEEKPELLDEYQKTLPEGYQRHPDRNHPRFKDFLEVRDYFGFDEFMGMSEEMKQYYLDIKRRKKEREQTGKL